MRRAVKKRGFIIAYLIWKGSYNIAEKRIFSNAIIAYLIWKGSYNKEPLRARLMDCFAVLAMTIEYGARLMDCFAVLAMTIEQGVMLYNDAKNC